MGWKLDFFGGKKSGKKDEQTELPTRQSYGAIPNLSEVEKSKKELVRRIDLALQQMQSPETVSLVKQLYKPIIEKTTLYNGNSLLHILACNPNFNPAIWKVIADKQVDFAIKNKDGMSVLNMAIMQGNDSVVQFLLGQGVQVEADDLKLAGSLSNEKEIQKNGALYNHAKVCELLQPYMSGLTNKR